MTDHDSPARLADVSPGMAGRLFKLAMPFISPGIVSAPPSVPADGQIQPRETDEDQAQRPDQVEVEPCAL